MIAPTMREPVSTRSGPLRIFPTRAGAERWATSFSYGRAFNNQPPLEVEPHDDGWAVVNPALHIVATAPRVPYV